MVLFRDILSKKMGNSLSGIKVIINRPILRLAVCIINPVLVHTRRKDRVFDVKKKNAQRFLEDGDKVKVTIMFRGRELSHPELGRQILVRMAAELKDIANVERDAKLEGKNMIMILAAKQH